MTTVSVKSLPLSLAVLCAHYLMMSSLCITSVFAQPDATKRKAPAATPKKKTPAASAVTTRSAAQGAQPGRRGSAKQSFTFQGAFLTQMHLRNDNDFDPSKRFDDLDGQSDGQLASFFSPIFTARAGDDVTVRYQLDLGWNAWSRNDPGQPNQFFSMRTPGLLARHKQAWAQWRGDGVRLRAGFQQVKDPTGLFLDHTIGALNVRLNLGAKHKKMQHLTLLMGQLPDTTIEGFDIRNDNLVTDSFLFGISHRGVVTSRLSLRSGLYYLQDRRALERPLDLGVGALSLRWQSRDVKLWADVAGQYGSWANSTVGGGDADVRAWAAQIGYTHTQGKVDWGVNVLAISADDDHDGNDTMGAFLGSARNRSRTIFLTEDETRDRYDNLDERLGSYWGPLAYAPAGLMVSEASTGVQISPSYHARLVLAMGVVLNPARTLGQRYAGGEFSLLQTFSLSDRARLIMNGLLFMPGGAAAAMINDIKRSARRPLYGGSVGFAVQF